MNSFNCIEHKNVKILQIGIRSNGIRSNGIRSKGSDLENQYLYACPPFSQNLPLLPGKLTGITENPIFQGQIRSYST